MPMFMDVHNQMAGITEKQLREAHNKDVAQQKNVPGVRFLKAWADPSSGKVFCLSEGPNQEAIQRVHERAGHRADEIYQISYEIE